MFPSTGLKVVEDKPGRLRFRTSNSGVRFGGGIVAGLGMLFTTSIPIRLLHPNPNIDPVQGTVETLVVTIPMMFFGIRWILRKDTEYTFDGSAATLTVSGNRFKRYPFQLIERAQAQVVEGEYGNSYKLELIASGTGETIPIHKSPYPAMEGQSQYLVGRIESILRLEP